MPRKPGGRQKTTLVVLRLDLIGIILSNSSPPTPKKKNLGLFFCWDVKIMMKISSISACFEQTFDEEVANESLPHNLFSCV